MKFYTALALCLFTFGAVASQKAVTEQGDVVILNDDGTWVYQEGKPAKEQVITINPQNFSKPENSKFQLKSNRTNAAFWIDPKKWSFKKNANGHDSAEYTFNVKGQDLYAMVISEQLEIELEQLAVLALDNARNAAADIKVVNKEYRMVNGKKVIFMEMEGTIQSIKFTYMGYYYSDESGSTQYLAYTGSNLVKKHQKDIMNFLNGFTTQQ